MDEDDEILNWRDEAEAVVRDIEKHVREIKISEKLESNETAIFMNLTTLEEGKYCIKLSCQGFQVVGKQHDEVLPALDEELYPAFETPYALLGHLSPRYTQSFGDNLVDALQSIR